MDMLKELMKKKEKSGGKDMDPKYKDAKMGVLKHISDMASKSMGDEIQGLKKVEVAASDRKGLEEGLDKAKELVSKEGEPLDGDAMDEPEPSLKEHGKHPMSEDEDMSPEEIDEMIAELQAKKAALKK